MSRKSLSDEQNERLRVYVRELLKRQGGSQSELVLRLGLSQPAISAFLSGRQGTSYRVAERVATLLKLDVRDVLHGARDLAATLAATDPRQEAARLAADDGVYAGAIQSVLDEDLSRENEGRSTLWWAMRMKLREHELLQASPKQSPTSRPRKKRTAPG